MNTLTPSNKLVCNNCQSEVIGGICGCNNQPTRTEMKCKICSGFSSSQICWSCASSPGVQALLAKQSPQGIEAEVCRDLSDRQAKGIAKYGVSVELNPLPLKDWLQHAYEECLDQAVYLKRAIKEL